MKTKKQDSHGDSAAYTDRSTVEVYASQTDSSLDLPCMSFAISAGFPSPALDFVDVAIDLNTHLIAHPAATYFGRVQGDSMRDAGITDGDLLVIDKSIVPADGKIAVCYLDGEFTLKRIKVEQDAVWLVPENESYPPIRIEEGNTLTVWGVVTYVIKKTI